MPKNSKFASNIYTSWWDWSENIFNINFKESISFECPYPVIFCPFGILAICLTYKWHGNISKKTTVTFAFKMLKQMFLHVCFISCIFPVISLVIIASKTKFSCGFPYILLTTTRTCKEMNQTVIITISSWFILQFLIVIVLVNVLVSKDLSKLYVLL